ncbi:S-layer homology domain-containing protein [Oscillospiraceae bacterium OttesenSCG-928-G22]|nr:S-layer homology domain-containing protein [Oscillospiraceae bacterium OttesenSCG-928-G22]
MKLSLPAGALESMRALAKTLRFGLAPGSVIFDLTDTNGKAIDWLDYANPVTVSMAYTPPQDISAHQIVMVREDGSVVPRSWYSDGSVYAKISEPGTYDAAIKSLGNFTDTKGLWMDEAVSYMATRGIVEGVGDGLFDRSGTITRAHFVTMLMRALDVSDVATTKDIPATDYDDVPDWTKEHVITAKAIGITLSGEDGRFNPNAPITRQEMFYMAYEAMEACGMLPEVFTEQWIIFSDWDGVNAEYSDAIQNLCKLGLVNGNGDGTLNPAGTSTRAEGAQFLYNILRYDAK